MMYFTNLKLLRNENDLTQENIAKYLNVKRSTYSNWESNLVMIPIEMADKLSIFYKVKLSYIIGCDNNYKVYDNIKAMNYGNLIKNLHELKIINNNTFEEIGAFLNCNKSTCQRYFNNSVKIPIDKLVILSEVYEFDIDVMSDKI